MTPISVADKRLIEGFAADPATRAALAGDPLGTAERLLGRPLPGTRLEVLEEPEGEVWFAVPPPGVPVGALPQPATRRQVFENYVLEVGVGSASPALREQAARDPEAVFRDITNNAPEGRLRLFWDGPEVTHLVLPRPSEDITDHLPDDLLDFVSGGGQSPCNSVASRNAGAKGLP